VFLEAVPSGEAEGSFAGNKLFSLMFSLHFGDFAGTTSRVLWFLFGLAAAISAATGTKLWLLKRAGRDTQATPGVRLMASINLAVCAGLPLALAATFAAWPVQRFFDPGFSGYGGSAAILCITWATAVLASFVTPQGERLGRVILVGAAVLAILAVVLRGALLGDSPWQAFTSGRTSTFLIDLMLLATGGVTLAFAALRQRNPVAESVASSRDFMPEQPATRGP
jgi:hypothetical protein